MSLQRGVDAPGAHGPATSHGRPSLGSDSRMSEPLWGLGRLVELGGIAPRPRWSARMVAAAGVVVLMIGVLALKLAQLQVYDSSTLAALARSNTVHRTVLEADRGIIYDRHGVGLVHKSPVWNPAVVPADPPAHAP